MVLLPFYNGPEAEAREKFKAFIDVGPIMDMTKEIPYQALNGIQVSTCSASCAMHVHMPFDRIEPNGDPRGA